MREKIGRYGNVTDETIGDLIRLPSETQYYLSLTDPVCEQVVPWTPRSCDESSNFDFRVGDSMSPTTHIIRTNGSSDGRIGR